MQCTSSFRESSVIDQYPLVFDQKNKNFPKSYNKGNFLQGSGYLVVREQESQMEEAADDPEINNQKTSTALGLGTKGRSSDT